VVDIKPEAKEVANFNTKLSQDTNQRPSQRSKFKMKSNKKLKFKDQLRNTNITKSQFTIINRKAMVLKLITQFKLITKMRSQSMRSQFIANKRIQIKKILMISLERL
jgi:hypothetical protein